jgi:hypothetical protein
MDLAECSDVVEHRRVPLSANPLDDPDDEDLNPVSPRPIVGNVQGLVAASLSNRILRQT